MEPETADQRIADLEKQLEEANERIKELEQEKSELEDKCNLANDTLGMIWREAKDVWTKL